MRISDWSSDVCYSDLEGEREVDRAAWRGDVGREAHVVLHVAGMGAVGFGVFELALELVEQLARRLAERVDQHVEAAAVGHADDDVLDPVVAGAAADVVQQRDHRIAALERERSEEHTSELQSLMRSSYAVFCLKK